MTAPTVRPLPARSISPPGNSAVVHAAVGTDQPGADPHRGGHRAELRPVAVRAGDGGARAGAGVDFRWWPRCL